MDETEDKQSEVYSCFVISQPLKISMVDLNKKRKLQAEPLDSPEPKHKCWDRSFTTGPVSIFGQTTNVDTLIDKGKREAVAQDDESELESAKDSNSMADDSDSAITTYFGGKVEPECSMMCSSDRPSTSSASWGSSGNSLGMLNTNSNKEEQGVTSADYIHPVSEIQECQNFEKLLAFGNIEQCTDEELDDILGSNGNGVNPNMYVLSSGRWSVGQGPQKGSKKQTIDQEFEHYFSMLML